MGNVTKSMNYGILSKVILSASAKTPEEIAVSIIAEILSVINNKEPFPLKTITGKIHQE